MALDLSLLEIELRKIMDPAYSAFVGFPATTLETIQVWADIIDAYGSDVEPTSSTTVTAKDDFILKFSDLDPQSQNGLDVFIEAMDDYAAELANGMSGYNSSPPPISISMDQVSDLGLSGGSGQETSELLAQTIDDWFKTGTATPTSGGSTINWF